MYKQVEKSKENKSRAVASSVSKNKNYGKQAVEFVDNRKISTLQRTIKKIERNSKQPQSSKKLSGGYKEAFDTLALGVPGKSPLSDGIVCQMMLIGDYAAAAIKIGSYMGKSAARSAEKLLQNAQDLGFRAPNLPGHMSKSSGKDDKGEKERQKQINAAWEKWKKDFALWRDKKDEDDDSDGAAGGSVASSSKSSKRTQSTKDQYKEQRAYDKRKQYEESQRYEYVAPWHGGPSAWPK